MSKRKKWGLIGGGVTVVALIVITGAMKGRNKATEVRIEPVEKRDLVASVTARGRVQPQTKVDLSADITGRVVRLAVKEGDMVTRGQFLLEIDPVQYQAAVERASAAVASSRSQAATARPTLVQARRNYDRLLALKKENPTLVSDEQVEQLKTQVEVAEAQLSSAQNGIAQAQASLRDASSALSKTTIVAPMSGRVTRLNVELGETAIMGTLNKDAATLLTISDMGALETKVKVDETDVSRIEIGDSAVIQIDAFPDTTFVGRVAKISNSSVKNAAAQSGVGGSTDQAIDNKVTFRPVKVGIAGEKYFEIVSGLKEKERIVAGTYQAIRDLKDGTLVKEAKVEKKKG